MDNTSRDVLGFPRSIHICPNFYFLMAITVERCRQRSRCASDASLPTLESLLALPLHDGGGSKGVFPLAWVSIIKSLLIFKRKKIIPLA